MIKKPKRFKDKYNPYTLNKDDNNDTYTVSFKDCFGKQVVVRVSVEVYELMNQFELDDKSVKNEYDRHIEHSELYESTLHKRMTNAPKPADESLLKEIESDYLRCAIRTLPKIQERRLLLYYFEDKTLCEIALMEGCSKVAVKYSLDAALANLRKILNREASCGWEYHSMETIAITEKPGCFQQPVRMHHYMLIFYKEQ